MKRCPIPIVSIDFETDLISPAAQFPPPVCVSAYYEEQDQYDLLVVGEHDVEGILRGILESCIRGDARLVNQYLAFDLRVACNAWPSLLPLVKQLYNTGMVGDPSLREKFLDLGTHGAIGFDTTPDGGMMSKSYSLADLVLRYSGKDIKASKIGKDSWRLRYSELRGVPFASWPQEAVDYVLDDSRWATYVWRAQEERIDYGHQWPVEGGELSAEYVNLRTDFTHTGVTQRGLLLDPDRAEVLWGQAKEDMDIDNFPLLVEAGIVIPEVPPMPYAKGTLNEDGTPKMKRAVKESLSRKTLQAHVIRRGRELAIRIDLTDKGIDGFKSAYGERKLSVAASHECFDEHPEWASAGKGTIGTLAGMDDAVATEMQARAKVEKLVTSYFPGLCWDFGHNITGKKAISYLDETKTPPPGWTLETADVRWAETIHPNFDLLKDTGRSSSYGGDLYPSVNIHQVDPRIRTCYYAREGYILVSIDFAGDRR